MTLEEARDAAIHVVCEFIRGDCLRCPFNPDPAHAITKGCQAVASNAVTAVMSSLERSGYVLCNKTLTVDQRNKMTDVFHNSFQSMQSVHEAMLKGVK